MHEWRDLVRDIPDHPRPGILFKDITPLLADGEAFAAAIDAMLAPWRGVALDAVLGIEARGFILGAAMARALGTGFVPVRKSGRLPAPVHAQDYPLEYGTDTLEIHRDAMASGARVLIVDDVMATGGTLRATLALARKQGMAVVGAAVLLELAALQARQDWDPMVALEATVVYTG